MKNNTQFAEAIEVFFTKHLPHQKGVRTNTIASYRDAFKLYLRFNFEFKKISPEHFTLDLFTANSIIDFLNYLQQKRQSSTRTRNQRLASMHSFTHYLQFEYPERLHQWQKILMIPQRRYQPKKLQYLTADEITEFMSVVNQHGNLRDKTMLEFLYDTGIRVQELIDVRRGDVKCGSLAEVQVCGKGGKVRMVPLLKVTVKLLKKYMGVHDVLRLEENLFLNRNGEKLSRSGVLHIIKKYVEIVKLQNSTFPVKVTPHMFRHSKAQHLLEGGCSNVSIKDLLGHADIQTTAIYAQADTEMVRDGLAKINKSFAKSLQNKRDWQQDSTVMEFLNNL